MSINVKFVMHLESKYNIYDNKSQYGTWTVKYEKSQKTQKRGWAIL